MPSSQELLGAVLPFLMEGTGAGAGEGGGRVRRVKGQAQVCVGGGECAVCRRRQGWTALQQLWE